MIKKTLLAAALAMVSFAAVAAERSVTLAVDNMTCALCPVTVKKALLGVDGVVSATVSDKTASAVVVYDDAKVQVSALARAITEAGYPARPK